MELAKCEDQADFVGKAKEEADRAVGLDYGSLLDVEALTAEALEAANKAASSGGAKQDGAGAKKGVPADSKKTPSAPSSGNAVAVDSVLGEDLDRARPLDHIIKPYVESFGLRVSVYDQPAEIEGQVILLLQQAKESPSVSFQGDALVKASAFMNDLVVPKKNKRQLDRTLSTTLSSSAAASMLGADPTLAELEEVLMKPRGEGATLDTFTAVVQRRTIIMSNIAQLAQLPHQRNRVIDTPSAIRGATTGSGGVSNNLTSSQQNTSSGTSTNPNKSSLITQRSALYSLARVWNPSDQFHRELLDAQIEMHYYLAGALVDKLSSMWIDPDAEQEYNRDVDAAIVKATAKAARVAAGLELDTASSNDGKNSGIEFLVPDPRALGLESKYASEEMNKIKKLVLLCLQKGNQYVSPFFSCSHSFCMSLLLLYLPLIPYTPTPNVS